MKRINVFLICMMLFASLVMAGPPTPGPVQGKVTYNAELLSGYEVSITNSETGETLTSTEVQSLVTDNGVYAFDLSEFSMGYSGGYIIASIGSDEISFKVLDTPFLAPTLELGTAPEEPAQTTSSDTEKTSSAADYYYGEAIDIKIGNNKISKLLDTEIRFDGENYDIEEFVYLKGMFATSFDDVDYGTDPYLVIDELKYLYTFIDLFPIDDVTEDETLTLNLLGKEYEISDIKGDELTLFAGKEEPLLEGESFEGLKVMTIGDDYIFVEFNGATAKIDEGEIGEVGGIEVYVKDVMQDDDVTDFCLIRIAEDVEERIEDGDDFFESEIYAWVIDMDADPQVIGVINQEEFEDLDEDAKPLALGEKLSLPNEYLDIKFGSLSEGDRYELDIRVKDDGLIIEGDFTYDSEDYNEVFLNSVGFYDDDDLITIDKLQIGDGEYYAERGSLKVGDLRVLLDMTDITYDAISYALKDDDFLDYFGIIFKNPEDAVDDKRSFKVSVPEERPEATIVFGDDLAVEIEPEACEEVICPTCEVKECVEQTCPACDVCTTCEVCPECEDGISLMVTALVGILTAAGGAGVMFKLFNDKMFVGKNTGVKSYRGRNGELKIHHKHPGTTGYHSTETSHRDPEKHPKGMIDVGNKYLKNAKGEWEFIG